MATVAQPLISGMPTQTSSKKRSTVLPPKSQPDAVSTHVRTLISQARTLRRSEETNWYIDAKFIAGDQWLSWDPRRSTLYTKPKKKWRIRQTVNHMRPDMEILIDILTSNTGTPRGKPSTPDPQRREGSRAAVKHFKHEWRRQDMDDIADELALWTLACGLGVLKAGWDPDSGEVINVPDFSILPEGEVPPPDFEFPEVAIPVGQLTTELVPTFNFFVDPAATNQRNARWMGDVAYMHVEEARARWPELAAGINPDTGADAWFDYARRLQYRDSARTMSDDVSDSVNVLTIFFRPSADRPAGRKVVVAGTTVVEDTDSPWGGRFPYAIFRCFRNVGSFYGQSAANLGRNVQKALNSHRSLVMEHLVKSGHTQWIAMKGAGLKRSDFNDAPGNVMFANPIGADPVRPLQPAPMPPGWAELLRLDQSDLHTLLGVADVLRGVNPPGVRAGRTFAYAVEQIMGRHRPLVRRFARGWTQLARLWLHAAKEFYAEDRMLQIVGDSGAIEVYHLRSADLEDAEDIFIDAESAMPESATAREDKVMTLFGNGLIVDDAGMPDPRKALKMMKLEGLAEDDIYESDADDRAWAVEENERMAAGEPVMPQPHDNHPQHLDIHVAFMRTSNWRQLPDDRKMIFRQHLDIHIMTMQGEQAQVEPPLEEAGPGGGGPSEDKRGGGTPTPEPRKDMRGGPD